MARLAENPGVAALALRITILTCARTNETLGMTFDEIDLDKAVWSIPKERMKMGREHQVPLSDAAVAILRRQHDERGNNPHVFPGRPMRSLSNMALAMLMRRLKIDATVHGFRASARSWMADQGVAFELAEAALAHTVGNAVVQSYERSSSSNSDGRSSSDGPAHLPRRERGRHQAGGGVMIGDKSAFTNLDRKVRRGRVLPLGCVLKLRTLRWRLARPPPTLPTPTFTAVYSDKGS